MENLKISKVTKEDNGYTIDAEGTCFFYDEKYPQPKPGDIITLYTVNGSKIRGMNLNGAKLYYKTDEELEEEHKEYVEKYNKQKQEEFKKNKTHLDKQYDSLPEFFQKRIDKYRHNNPDFRVEYESYEMFCCTEAVKIANSCKTPDKVKEFSEMSFEQQVEIANISDGHSGNTIGMAIRLAYFYLLEPENVIKLHGAMAPLVGSKEYGDTPKIKEIRKRKLNEINQ